MTKKYILVLIRFPIHRSDRPGDMYVADQVLLMISNISGASNFSQFKPVGTVEKHLILQSS